MAGGSELLIRLGVETASAQKNIREVNKELKSLKDQIALANTATGNYNKTSQGLSQQLSLQEKSLEALNTKLKLQKEVYEKNRQELEKRKDKLEELQKTESENTKEIKKAQEQVEQAQRQLNQANRDIQKTEAEIEAMNRTIGATKTALQEVEKQAKVQAIQQWADETSNKFKAVSKACTSMAMALTPMAMVISSAFKSAFQSASEFEQGLANVQAVAGFTQEELSQVRDEAKRLGQELPITAKDCADGFGYLALAGYDLEQQLASIEPIAKASVAWQEDLGTTSDLVTDSLSSLGMEVEDLGKYLNVVSQAQASSNTTATDMLKAYIQVGGVLNGLNIPLEESASLLGIMANRGVKAQEAGNALSSVMANLTTGTGRAGKALEALGISAFDSTGNFRGMEAILTDLNKAFSTMSEEEANYYKA